MAMVCYTDWKFVKAGRFGQARNLLKYLQYRDDAINHIPRAGGPQRPFVERAKVQRFGIHAPLVRAHVHAQPVQQAAQQAGARPVHPDQDHRRVIVQAIE